jgi:hypothetical protein
MSLSKDEARISAFFSNLLGRAWRKRQRIAAAVIPERRSLIRDWFLSYGAEAP